MLIGIGLSLPYRSWASGAIFSPESLFAASEAGAWHDPSDLSTLWQDTSGTVSVTADGQSVARVDDKSGNDNHLTQGTASKRPVYKTSGGRRWMLFDGVDDALLFILAEAWPQPATQWAAFRHTGGTSPDIINVGDSAATRNQCGVRSGQFEMYAGTISDIRASDTTDDYSLVAKFDGAASSAIFDGVETAEDAGIGSPTSGKKFALGSFEGTSAYLAGRIYATGTINRELTASEETQLVAYLNGKAGL
jgi:hypothetical protein